MAIDRTAWGTLVDDDGTNTVGTPWTKNIVKTVILDPIDVAIAADDAVVRPVALGGTGLASYAVGDLLYASGATTLVKLSDVAVGQVLVSGGVGVAPLWSASPTLTSVVTSLLTTTGANLLLETTGANGIVTKTNGVNRTIQDSGNFYPATDLGLALGASTFRWTTGYFGTTIIVSAVAVASLPAGVEGMRASVTNATQTLTAGIGATVVGGGTNRVPVYYDGTNWIIG